MTPRRRLLPGSLRFRLTAWYALLLASVLAALGFLLMGLVGDRLLHDVDARLGKTAVDLGSSMQANGKRAQRDGYEPDIELMAGNLDSYASRGLLIQIIKIDDDREWVVDGSEYVRDARPLVAAESPPASAKHQLYNGFVKGEKYRLLRAPFKVTYDNGDVTTGAVIIGEPLRILDSTLDALRRYLIAICLAGLALAILGGWLLADRALRPVDRITATAATIADGNGTAASLGTRLDVPNTGDELARLSGTFNAMLDRLQAAFVGQQRFVADASHELRTPLTAIRGNVEVLARQVAALRGRDATDGDLDAAVSDMKRESARMGRLLDDLLLLARSDAPEGVPHHPRPVRLDDVARDAVRSAAPLATGQTVAVVAPQPVTVEGDPDRLLQLLLILLENALRHTPAAARVTIEVPPPAGGAARVVVRDEGEGIAPEHLPHLFERFYRADGARGRATGGTGLGLAIAAAIVRAHGGQIAVASAPGQGSTFTVTLPAAPTATAARPLPTAAREAASARGPRFGTSAPPTESD